MTAARQTKPRQAFVPSVETLENRVVPTVTYHGGALLKTVEIEAIYLGSAWSTNPTYQQQRTQFDTFLAHIANSSYMDMLTNAGYKVGRGTFLDSYVDPQKLGSSIDDTAIRARIQADIASGAVQSPGSQRLYIVFVAPNVLVTAGSANSANDFLGYHDDYFGKTRAGASIDLHYAVIPYEGGPNAGIYPFSAFDGMTEVVSHELAEAVTDPEPEGIGGWYDDTTGEEIGDIVAQYHVRWDGYLVQKEAAKNGAALAPAGTLVASPVNPITLTAGGSFSGALATFTDGDTLNGPQSYTITINWGDGQTSTGAKTANADGSYTITAAHTWLTQGAYSVTVTITNSNGVVGQATDSITVGKRTTLPANIGAVSTQLTHSYERYYFFVAGAYQTYLGRAASTGEINGWAAQMQNGLSDEAVEASFIGSAEYIAKNGGSGAGWISAMYTNLLGRSAAQAEINAWLQHLATDMTPAAIAQAISASFEREYLRVAADYKQYLHRAGSTGEITGWANKFMAGASNEDVIAGFIASMEYFQRNNMDAAKWLSSAYTDLFARPADTTANVTWLPQLG